MIRKSSGAVLAALLGLTMLASSAIAQDSTPDASPAAGCPTTTADENVQIVEDYFDHVIAGDAESADALLHDDFEHNLSVPGADVPNEPGNADEHENIEHAGDANHEVTHTVAQNDWIAVYYTFEVSGEHIEGADPSVTAETTAMVMARVECGQIAEALFEADMLGVLHQFGWEIHPPEGE